MNHSSGKALANANAEELTRLRDHGMSFFLALALSFLLADEQPNDGADNN